MVTACEIASGEMGCVAPCQLPAAPKTCHALAAAHDESVVEVMLVLVMLVLLMLMVMLLWLWPQNRDLLLVASCLACSGSNGSCHGAVSEASGAGIAGEASCHNCHSISWAPRHIPRIAPAQYHVNVFHICIVPANSCCCCLHLLRDLPSHSCSWMLAPKLMLWSRSCQKIRDSPQLAQTCMLAAMPPVLGLNV